MIYLYDALSAQMYRNLDHTKGRWFGEYLKLDYVLDFYGTKISLGPDELSPNVQLA